MGVPIASARSAPTLARLTAHRSRARDYERDPVTSEAMIYQAAGRSYWLSPSLVGRIGLRQIRDRLSLGYLVDRTVRFASTR